MIKIPGTPEGVPAIEQAIYEGINVNVTLLFAVEAYERVARGLSPRARAPPRGGASRSTSTRSPRSSSPAWTRTSTRSSKRSGAPTCRARRRSPTPAPPIAASRRSSRARAGRRSTTPARPCSDRCGPRPGTKNPSYPDTMYVDGLVGAAHRQHDAARHAARRSPTTARSPARPPSIDPTADLEALARGRDRHEAGHRRAARRRRRAVRGRDEPAARRDREGARGDRHRHAARDPGDGSRPSSRTDRRTRQAAR